MLIADCLPSLADRVLIYSESRLSKFNMVHFNYPAVIRQWDDYFSDKKTGLEQHALGALGTNRKRPIL